VEHHGRVHSDGRGSVEVVPPLVLDVVVLSRVEELRVFLEVQIVQYLEPISLELFLRPLVVLMGGGEVFVSVHHVCDLLAVGLGFRVDQDVEHLLLIEIATSSLFEEFRTDSLVFPAA